MEEAKDPQDLDLKELNFLLLQAVSLLGSTVGAVLYAKRKSFLTALSKESSKLKHILQELCRKELEKCGKMLFGGGF